MVLKQRPDGALFSLACVGGCIIVRKDLFLRSVPAVMTSECHLGTVLVDNRLQGATRNCLQLKQTKGGISVGVTVYFFLLLLLEKKC